MGITAYDTACHDNITLRRQSCTAFNISTDRYGSSCLYCETWKDVAVYLHIVRSIYIANLVVYVAADDKYLFHFNRAFAEMHIAAGQGIKLRGRIAFSAHVFARCEGERVIAIVLQAARCP